MTFSHWPSTILFLAMHADEAQANAKNVTDKKYLNSFPSGQAFYGEPANYTLAVKFKY